MMVEVCGPGSGDTGELHAEFMGKCIGGGRKSFVESRRGVWMGDEAGDGVQDL